MDKAYRSEFRRSYLIEGLPEPLARWSRHIQLFDNYIEGTRLRLRSVRDPETKQWTRILQHRIHQEGQPTKYAEIYLDESEHGIFEQFEGREIRKNRYYHEFAGLPFSFDLYLGPLWGLNIASVILPEPIAEDATDMPHFTDLDITDQPLFLGENLVGKTYEDVRTAAQEIFANSERARMAASEPF